MNVREIYYPDHLVKYQNNKITCFHYTLKKKKKNQTQSYFIILIFNKMIRIVYF